jgi:hypothetical protein
MLCSKNLVYAIADTAVSALLGPNPQVAATPRNPLGEDAASSVNGLMEYIFNANNMRRRAATALIDSVLCKRGIFKTGWSVEKDAPIVKVVDPSTLFFDLTVRDVDDIRYWLEATVLPFSEFKKRVESGYYSGPGLDQVQPDRYPKWMLGARAAANYDRVRDAFQWITVWEYYDRENNIVQHYIQQADQVVFEQEIDYIPYSMFSLNQSGIDCLGLSEVQLILNQQETVNDLLTHMKQITYLMIPKILYDSGRISEEDLNKAAEASSGAIEDLATKAFWLCKKYMKTDKMVRVAGSRKWDTVNLSTLADVKVSFEMVAYNPIRQNPSILAETMVQMLPFLMQDPNIDTRKLTEEVVASLSLSNSIVMPEQEVAQKVAAQAELAQQQALGGAAVVEEEAQAEGEGMGPLPPELEQLAIQEAMAAQGATPEESFAAGGGSPVRQ